ncbi:fumarylacetoacetase [Colletotrichum orchidophilum]|uniref:Fumarylacetoacetase n=1 Tax=Colletotrichum orchidophilum TaxID=1209926 RepID=A0A1G4ANQ2_9PEZI|nr:fumarylacetoacetase [Colletotrichum orchidophilum]OHE90787.1 fumarylacetoacetase [Colletotrichum orchidophilum]
MAANRSPFTIHNLPYGINSTQDNATRRCAVAFNEWAVDLDVLWRSGVFDGIEGLEEHVFNNDNLNAFAALPKTSRLQVREKLIELLSKGDVTKEAETKDTFHPLEAVEMHFPMDTRNFSDFYCSLEHTKNCTAIFGNNQISPSWFTIPSVYNGRTSSLVVSGTPITRPLGVFPASNDGSVTAPAFQPETHLDFELEMGIFLSKSVPRGRRLQIQDAKESIFGLVLLNDWSSRNTQFFEMAPLGPFHAKGSATSISPWIVPVEALEAVACPRHAPQEPAPLPHLKAPSDEKATFNIETSVKLIREGKMYAIGQSNLNELHWTPFQQLTHLGSAGEGLSTGDLFGTGTISSARTNGAGEKIGLGCLYERKLTGNELTTAPPDIIETFLQDGDEVVLEGWAIQPETGEVLFGFGESRGKVLPAV